MIRTRLAPCGARRIFHEKRALGRSMVALFDDFIRFISSPLAELNAYVAASLTFLNSYDTLSYRDDKQTCKFCFVQQIVVDITF